MGGLYANRNGMSIADGRKNTSSRPYLTNITTALNGGLRCIYFGNADGLALSELLGLTLPPKTEPTNVINTLKIRQNPKNVVHNIYVDKCKKVEITVKT